MPTPDAHIHRDAGGQHLGEDRTGQAPLQEIYRSFPVLAHADQLYGPILPVPYYSTKGIRESVQYMRAHIKHTHNPEYAHAHA